MSDFSKHDITNLTWEQGSIGSSGNMNSTTRVRTPGYIPIHSKSSLTTSLQLYATSNLSRTINVNYMLYKEDKSLLFEDIWRANNEIKTFNYDIGYVRLVIRFSNNSSINPSNITSARFTFDNQLEWCETDNHPDHYRFIELPTTPFSDGSPEGFFWYMNKEDIPQHQSAIALPDSPFNDGGPDIMWRIKEEINKGKPFIPLMLDLPPKPKGDDNSNFYYGGNNLKCYYKNKQGQIVEITQVLYKN